MSHRHRSKEEWLSLINECRRSGLSDYEWCQRNGISHHTFYKAARRLRKSACGIVEPKPSSCLDDSPVIKQDVVPIQIVDEPIAGEPDCKTGPVPMISHDTEPYRMTISIGQSTLRICNGVDPVLLESAIRALGITS